ncbi:MAG: hypothetical protein FD166_3765, partial [Bacteroidetes bacterium]
MKKIILLFAAAILIAVPAKAQLPCASEGYEEYLKANDPGYEERMQQKNEEIQGYLKNNPVPAPRAVVIIPVVFHVVWQTSQQNLSDACLIDQITSLNRDFRKLNADLSLAPSQFQAVAAD